MSLKINRQLKLYSFCFICSAGLCAQASLASSADVAFKFTPAYYFYGDGNRAIDLNLRATREDQVGWLGFYRDHLGFEQARIGFEQHEDFDYLRLVLSGQGATHGFLGASVNAEIGSKTYALVGLGRTNLQDYYNLNFDPNDAITLGLGTRAAENTELSVYRVQDNRLGTGQRVTHVLWRQHVSAKERLTVDFSHKSGRDSSGAPGGGNGLTMTYDIEPWFARAGFDADVNFSGHSMVEAALGRRF
jgi:hypothetical protein